MEITTTDLEALIAELMKNEPNQLKVKELTGKQGISYHQDPLHQMNEVLIAMNQTSLVKTLKEKETSI